MISGVEINRSLYYPETRKKGKFIYEEVVKYLIYLGYEIKINEEEYYQLENNKKIPAICPLKHGIRNIYLNSLKKGGSCCRECGQEKYKKTCLEKYGSENPMQNKDIREKVKKTCLEKYGSESPMQNKDIREKHKQTCLEKFGTEYPGQSEEIKEKKKQTYLKNFGVEHVSF